MTNNENRRFEVIWEPNTEKVEIHLNQAGVEYLLDLLLSLKDGGAPNDLHLMTPSWGGEELTEVSEYDGELVNHLKIYKW